MNIYNDDGTRKALAGSDKIRLGQRVEALEARTGEPSAQRLLAERAIEVIRASSSPEDMRDRADRAACTVVIEDTIGPNGKIRYSGFVKADDGTGLQVKLSALPKDCSAYNIMKRFEEKPEAKPKAMTANQAKFHGRAAFKAAEAAAPASFDAFLADAEKRLSEKGMSIERQGKTGAYLRFAEGDEGKIKLSSLGGKYSLSALNKRFNESSTANASFMHGKQANVNALSKKDASGHASTIQSDRAHNAQERADAAEDRAATAAVAAVQAGVDGMDGFYELDFFEQVSVMTRVAGVEAAARAATARWADAEERALELETRAQNAEMALSMSQPIENTYINNKEVEVMNEFTPNYHVAKTAAMLACHSLAELKDRTWAAKELEDLHHALTGAGRMYQIRPDADTQALLEATSRLGELCNDVHRYDDQDARAKIPAAWAQVKSEIEKVSSVTVLTPVNPGTEDSAGMEIETVIHEFPHPYDPDDTAPRRIPAWALKAPEDRTPAERRHEEMVGAEIAKEEKSLREQGWSEDRIQMYMGAVRVPEILGAEGEKLYTPEMRAAEEAEMKAAARAFAASFDTAPASTSIDADNSKSAGVGSGKAPEQAGPRNEKTANAAPDKEIQAPKRKFSFGNMFGSKKLGSNSGPSSGPKM